MKTNGLNVNALNACMSYNGMKQKDLAEAIGVTRVTVNRILQGKTSPTLDTIQKIATVLKMTPEQFVEVFYNFVEAFYIEEKGGE